MIRRVLVWVSPWLLLVGCGPKGPTAKEIVNDPRVQSAAKDAHDAMLALVQAGVAGTGATSYGKNGRGWSGLNACELEAENVTLALKYASGSKAFDTYPKTAERNLEGTFKFTDCLTIATSDSLVLGGSCSGSITFSNQNGSAIEQTNVSQSSSGQGAVTWALINQDGSGWIVQRNHATGAGCTQEITNVISLLAPGSTIFGDQLSPPLGPTDHDGLILTFIHSSTCPAPKWKCSVSAFRR